jgi:hypothetical protein
MEVLRFWADELAKPRYADPKCLLRYGFKVYSQADEDGIIQEIFNRIGETDRAFVEIGVGNGSECNTAKLLVAGWRGLWIESPAESIAAIRPAASISRPPCAIRCRARISITAGRHR